MSDQQSISEVAYALWQARGCPEGSSAADWHEAEKQVATSLRDAHSTSTKVIDEALEETFPASDPPASHLPDEPPSNAAEKWAAANAKPKP